MYKYNDVVEFDQCVCGKNLDPFTEYYHFPNQGVWKENTSSGSSDKITQKFRLQTGETENRNRESKTNRPPKESQPTKHKNIYWYAKYLTYLLLLSAISFCFYFYFISCLSHSRQKKASFVEMTPNQFSELVHLIRIITCSAIQIQYVNDIGLGLLAVGTRLRLNSDLGFNMCDCFIVNVKIVGINKYLGSNRL